jgi:large subunit ribosomal protein L24e
MWVRIHFQKESSTDKLDCPLQKETQGQSEGRNSKEKNRRVVKFQLADNGVSFAAITAKKNQKLDVRKLSESGLSGLSRKQKDAKQASKKTAMAAAGVPTKATPK